MCGYVNAEQNVSTVRRFYEAIASADVQGLDDVCNRDFRIVEPQVFPEPIQSLDDFRRYIGAQGTRGSFELLEADPLGNSLITLTAWMPPEGDPKREHADGHVQRWRAVWSFWDGKISRIDGKRLN